MGRGHGRSLRMGVKSGNFHQWPPGGTLPLTRPRQSDREGDKGIWYKDAHHRLTTKVDICIKPTESGTERLVIHSITHF